MGGDARASTQESESPGHLPSRPAAGEYEGDAIWLLWDAALLATALDAQQRTHFRRLATLLGL